jgi:ribose transport system permease protein
VSTATTAASGAAKPAAPRVPSWFPTPHSASALYLLALEFIVFAVWIPDLFFTSATFKLVLADQVIVAMMALGLLIPFVAGAFDLSVGTMVAFSFVIMSWLGVHTSLNSAIAALLALLACAFVGALSGIITVKFRVNSFIATLGMSQLLVAVTLYISEGRQIPSAFSATFLKFGQGDWIGVPRPVFYLAALALIVWYVLEWTPLGRNLFATGSNQEAARLTGVRTDRLILGSLVASAVVGGLAGIVYGMRVGTFSTTLGPPLLFPAFAALFFGSTQFKSRPNVWGTVLAAYVLAFGVKGLQLASQGNTFWITPAFNGAALLIAVIFAARAGHIPTRRRSAQLNAANSSVLPPVATHPDGTDETTPKTGSDVAPESPDINARR